MNTLHSGFFDEPVESHYNNMTICWSPCICLWHMHCYKDIAGSPKWWYRRR